MNETRTFSELRTSGLLWLINASVLHSRGFAIALVFDDQDEAIGWQLLGDGKETWTFGDECQEPFAAISELLAQKEQT
jgi:hypothetical protein